MPSVQACRGIPAGPRQRSRVGWTRGESSAISASVLAVTAALTVRCWHGGGTGSVGAIGSSTSEDLNVPHDQTVACGGEDPV